jgi:hypothetical protein
MKKLYTVLASLLFTASVFLPQQASAQAPEKMSYQAVIRDANNKLVISQAVGMKISILQTTSTGTAVYVETQTPTTNANGLVSIEIGGGTAVTGTFAAIYWANGPYFIKTETDPAGGTSYTITGTSQILSVPYAQHAKTAEKITGGIIEKEPAFNSSVAKNITAADTIEWFAKSNFSGKYIDLSGKPDFTKWDTDSTDNVTITGDQTIAGTKTFSGTVNADSINLTKKTTKYVLNTYNLKTLVSSPNISLSHTEYITYVTSTSTGQQYVSLGIDVPSQILGCAQRIKSVTINYQCQTTNVSITYLILRKVNKGTMLPMAGGAVSLTSTSIASYTLTPAGASSSFTDKRVYLVIGANFAANGASDILNIYEVVVETY